jgi:hypothetical protein
MLAKILGVVLLICGAALALKQVAAVVGGVFAFIGLALLVALVLGLLYLGWRWINGESALGKVIGALALVAGIGLAVPAAFGVVAGTFAALVLALKIALAGVLLYVGWGWVQNGDFRLPGRRYI